MDFRDEHYLWVERYRPQKIDDCILPDSLKNTFKSYAAQGRIPNLLLSGGAGMGKTTVAKALCNEVGSEYIMINGSDEGRKIETLRDTITKFASTVSLTDAKKVVILDEADYTNADSVQPALRSFMEEFSNNCSFIMTCNFKRRIMEPILSRCSVIDFKISSDEQTQIAASFYKRVVQILKNENVEFDKAVVAELVKKYFPDFRRILNELQRYSASGKIDTGIFINVSDDNYAALFTAMKEKDFNKVKDWVSTNNTIESAELYRTLYSKSESIVEKTSIPEMVIHLAEYQYKSAFVADQEINTLAALTMIMSSCKFR